VILSTATPLWPNILATLEPAMTRATFDTCLKGTSAVQNNGALTVLVPSAYALDWLEHRLRPQVETAARNVTGQDALEVRFEMDPGEAETAEQPELFFTGSYRDAYNEIVQPDNVLCMTRYYCDKWRPLLGNDLWILLWEMRRRCFWGRGDRVNKDILEMTFEDLGKIINVSEATARRLLYPRDPKKRELLKRFVTKIGVRRNYSKEVNRVVNEDTAWRVRLDDPLTPEDEEKLKNRLSSGSQNDY
jgi:chromosomal replication initiation ATPase DnaA